MADPTPEQQQDFARQLLAMNASRAMTTQQRERSIRALIEGDTNRDGVLSGQEIATTVLPEIREINAQVEGRTPRQFSMQQCLGVPEIQGFISIGIESLNHQLRVLNGEQNPGAITDSQFQSFNLPILAASLGIDIKRVDPEASRILLDGLRKLAVNNDEQMLTAYQNLRQNEPQLGALPRQAQLPTLEETCRGFTQRGA